MNNMRTPGVVKKVFVQTKYRTDLLIANVIFFTFTTVLASAIVVKLPSLKTYAWLA